MLERIERRATKIIPELRDLSYEERLKECGLTTLEPRQILNGYENIGRNIISHSRKIIEPEDEVTVVKDVHWISERTRSHRGQSMNETNYLQIV